MSECVRCTPPPNMSNHVNCVRSWNILGRPGPNGSQSRGSSQRSHFWSSLCSPSRCDLPPFGPGPGESLSMIISPISIDENKMASGLPNVLQLDSEKIPCKSWKFVSPCPSLGIKHLICGEFSCETRAGNLENYCYPQLLSQT